MRYDNQEWSRQGSGISVREQCINNLQFIWNSLITKDSNQEANNDLLSDILHTNLKKIKSGYKYIAELK